MAQDCGVGGLHGSEKDETALKIMRSTVSTVEKEGKSGGWIKNMDKARRCPKVNLEAVNFAALFA